MGSSFREGLEQRAENEALHRIRIPRFAAAGDPAGVEAVAPAIVLVIAHCLEPGGERRRCFAADEIQQLG